MEIYYEGTWRTVCNDNWHVNDANVVCRQLGFERALEATKSAAFGNGTGEIRLTNVRCTGKESSLRDCARYRWGAHLCGHDRYAGVVCNYAGPLYFIIKDLLFSIPVSNIYHHS